MPAEAVRIGPVLGSVHRSRVDALPVYRVGYRPDPWRWTPWEFADEHGRVTADGLHSTVRRLIFGDESQILRYLGFHTAAYTLAYRLSRAPSIVQAYHPGASRATNSSSTFRDNFETLMPRALAIAQSLSRVCSDTRTCTTGECF